MLRIILNWLKAKAEELLAEDQAGFRPGWSTVEKIFNNRVITEKHLQHQRDLFHNFVDFKKACDRVWHVGLWQVLRSFNMHKGLVQAIQAIHENSSSAILLNSQLRELFKTTGGVRQGCLLSTILFNLFLEKIMQETLHNHHTSISIGGRPICNLRFADDFDLMGGSYDELQDLTKRLVDRARHMERKSAQKRGRSRPTARTTSVQILAWTVKVRGGMARACHMPWQPLQTSL